MSQENEELEVEEETLPEEETTEEESDLEETEDDEQLSDDDSEEDDSVSLSKSDYTKLKRKALAYDSGKKTANKAPQENIAGDERLERIELRQEGYSPDEVNAIMDLGGTKMLNNKVVQSAIKQMRQEKKSKDAREPLSSKSPVYKKFTQDDFNKMSSKEMEKVLQE